MKNNKFPSPCGVWVVSTELYMPRLEKRVSVPLRGVGCFTHIVHHLYRSGVSVPLRGVGCFTHIVHPLFRSGVSVPLRGVGCFKLN